MKKEIHSTAVIDIGSNSIRLIIGELTAHKYKIIESLKNHVPIGMSTFYSGTVSFETVNVIIEILEKYKQIIKEYAPDQTIVIATTAIREARNKNLLLETIRRKTGFSVEVLKVGDIVYYIDTFLQHKLSKIYPLHEKNLMIAELGAGSMDVSIMHNGSIISHVGLPLGTLRMKQLIQDLSGSAQENIEAITEYIENEINFLHRNIPEIKIDDVIIIEENYISRITELLDISNDTKGLIKIKSKSIEKISHKLDKHVAGDGNLIDVPDDLQDNVAFITIILSKFLKLIKNKYIYLLETSLAEAVMGYNLLGLEQKDQTIRHSQLIAEIEYVCNKYRMDLKHLRKVAEIASIIFDATGAYMGCTIDDAFYLILAAYLHDIGSFINNREHHKHTEYIISNSSFFRLNENEINLIASIARYHRKSYPEESHEIYNSLLVENQLLAQKLSAILRIANALDISHKQKIKELAITIVENATITFNVKTYANFILERNSFFENSDYLEEITGCKINLVVKE